MIAFGCAITRPEDYRRWAQVGVRRAAEPDSVVFANSSPGSIFRAYNLLLDLAAAHDDLEALVLVHQDVEILAPDLCARIRETFSDPEVAVAGCVGALGVRSLAWWEGAVTWASFTHRYYEHGGGLLPAFTMDPAAVPPPYARLGEVDTIDGFIMVLSPWAVSHLRFDESLGQFHGYDFDFCMQARTAGRTVVTVDLKVIHHHSLELLSDPDNWVHAHVALAEKWESRLGDGSADGAWQSRARRAEALASASNVLRISAQMKAAARERELQGELASITGSSSWRLTRPARAIASRLRERRR